MQLSVCLKLRGVSYQCRISESNASLTQRFHRLMLLSQCAILSAINDVNDIVTDSFAAQSPDRTAQKRSRIPRTAELHDNVSLTLSFMELHTVRRSFGRLSR